MNTAHLDMHDKQGTHAPEESRWISPAEAMELQAVAISMALHLIERGKIGEAQTVLLDAQDATVQPLADRARDRADFEREMGPLPVCLNPVSQRDGS